MQISRQENHHNLEHADGALVFAHACKMGREGIVSKRLGSPYRSGRSPCLKMKNPACAAVKREAEEDWGMVRRGRRKISVFSVFLNFGPVLEETGRGPTAGSARP